MGTVFSWITILRKQIVPSDKRAPLVTLFFLTEILEPMLYSKQMSIGDHPQYRTSFLKSSIFFSRYTHLYMYSTGTEKCQGSSGVCADSATRLVLQARHGIGHWQSKCSISHQESRATLACLYRTSGRFYMLQLISVDSVDFTQPELSLRWSDTSSYWKGSWADVD